ncbi:hypothetical protein L6452_07201 [Arctium lappa]|uniref:Uncharacterized protein n=1 Tax=Arctium lappa TaxID=4217 RepID=A0ACB9EKP3_ARCLA|nr:hypothetical protein L6452_07201 [Arctium lappa]
MITNKRSSDPQQLVQDRVEEYLNDNEESTLSDVNEYVQTDDEEAAGPSYSIASGRERRIIKKPPSLVRLPKRKKAIGCKWVFAKKEVPNKDKIRYKSRLVAKGYAQKEGVDYNEIFSPVVKHYSIRILLAFVAQFEFECVQLDPSRIESDAKTKGNRGKWIPAVWCVEFGSRRKPPKSLGRHQKTRAAYHAASSRGQGRGSDLEA